MTEKLVFDDGVIELDINGNGSLRFNPADPNVYRRFLALARELPTLESKYVSEVEQNSGNELEQAETTLEKMHALDMEVKAALSRTFGGENNFDQLLDGVNLLAPGHNGQRVITNLMAALTPYVEDGIRRYQKDSADKAVVEAKQNRAQRRAK